ncbi:MAG: DUF2987 domain-containing protein [Shewanella sp.]|nr:DUF2987 domain-containing protein [Shewanella sp.]MCF1430344.1 DUF2987 domain-containing protein [Shewanella sp.]MCF1438099.1 DUF2987 domain-containing protein [Shewanella sp.]MCF1459319.1 DUF2987 domain-containing protein [Shewanella sp.]
MQVMRFSAAALLSLTVSTAVNAAEVSLRYEDFYSRMKLMYKNNYQLTELTFSVPRQQDCILESASISTERNSVPLLFTQAQRLYLPYDEELKQQRALVNLQLAGDAAHCGLAVQIRVRSPKADYDHATLEQLYREMDDMQRAMKGFPMKYFHLAIKGLIFTLPKDTKVVLTRDKGYEDFRVSGEWSVSAAQIAQLRNLTLSAVPEVISPWVE